LHNIEKVFPRVNYQEKEMKTLKYDDLPQGGFAGLLERQFVTDFRVFGARKEPVASNGIGNFVYLADANFQPHGETGMHPHREIDVISVMVDGRIQHEGSLENGQSLEAGMVQVQRAGAEGFTHNEINPDASINRMIQLWVLPDEAGQPAGYRVYSPGSGDRVKIYGGPKTVNENQGQAEHFDSETSIEVAMVNPGQTIEHEGEFMAYICKGGGVANDREVAARTLFSDTGLEFRASSETQLILIYTA
jgi:redox-sensitive bicupin YhaK (pirin superfamily)